MINNFQLKYGTLDTLVIKIPWDNLYTKPTTATIEGLQAIIVPSRGVPYDAESEENRVNEKKQRDLNCMENNRRKQREKPVAPSSLVERLATQVVKNLQVTIKKIHIRYEDKYTQPYKPSFAAGVTLESLQFVVCGLRSMIFVKV